MNAQQIIDTCNLRDDKWTAEEHLAMFIIDVKKEFKRQNEMRKLWE